MEPELLSFLFLSRSVVVEKLVDGGWGESLGGVHRGFFLFLFFCIFIESQRRGG